MKKPPGRPKPRPRSGHTLSSQSPAAAGSHIPPNSSLTCDIHISYFTSEKKIQKTSIIKKLTKKTQVQMISLINSSKHLRNAQILSENKTFTRLSYPRGNLLGQSINILISIIHTQKNLFHQGFLTPFQGSFDLECACVYVCTHFLNPL